MRTTRIIASRWPPSSPRRRSPAPPRRSGRRADHDERQRCRRLDDPEDRPAAYLADRSAAHRPRRPQGSPRRPPGRPIRSRSPRRTPRTRRATPRAQALTGSRRPSAPWAAQPRWRLCSSVSVRCAADASRGPDPWPPSNRHGCDPCAALAQGSPPQPLEAPMTAHRAPRTAHPSRTPAKGATVPPSGTARASRSRDAIAGHVYAKPAIRELRRPLDATFDPRIW